jgi:hypothetical protein
MLITSIITGRNRLKRVSNLITNHSGLLSLHSVDVLHMQVNNQVHLCIC